MKIVVGKQYRVINTPNGKRSSNGFGTLKGDTKTTVTVINALSNGQYNCQIEGQNNHNSYYDYELAPFSYNKEFIKEEIADVEKEKAVLEEEINVLNKKLEWMETVGIEEFDDNEYKVWQTLTLLENEDISKLDRMREIAKMLKD